MIEETRVDAERRRGRGAQTNPAGRFDRHLRTRVDDGWNSADDLPPLRTEVRVETPRRVITRNKSPDVSFDRSVNPYRGCEHGCVYCFARPSHAYLDLSPGLDFETKLTVKPRVAELLAKEFSDKSYRPDVLAIGTNTDPYQPIEKGHQLMRGILETLDAFNHPVAITTKGTLIERDLDLLTPLARKGLLRVGLTMTTLDPALSRKMEPRVPAPARRLRTMRLLADAGIDTRVLVSPVIPGLTDHELESVLEASAEAGATGGTWAMLRLPYEVSALFRDWLDTAVPGKAAKVMARVREAHGGKDYDPQWGRRMRGEGHFAELIGQRFKLACKRLDLTTVMPPLRTDLFKVPPRSGDQLSLF